MSDRIAAIFLVVLCVGYLLLTATYTARTFSDPLGARFVPGGVGFFLLATSLVLIFRPPERVEWPDGGTLRSLGIALAGFVAYAYLLEPIGFVLATTLVFTLFAWVFGAALWKGLMVGTIFSVTLYYLFVYALALYLPFGDLLERFV